MAIITALVVWLVRVRNRERELITQVEKNYRERKAVFMFLNNLGDRLTKENLALEPTLKIITEFVVDLTEAEAGGAFLLDPHDNHLSARVVHGMFPPLMQTTNYVLTKQKYLSERVKRERIPLGQGVIGEVAEKGEPILIRDATTDPRVPNSGTDGLSIRTIMVAPLKARGRILGVLAVVNKRGIGVFTDEEMDLLASLADQAASTVEMVKLYSELAEKQRIEQELRVAHDFQRMLLPASCPQPPGYQIAAFSAPALEVGGDYYDFFWVDDNERYLGIVIADVSGKGIPGALIMAVVRCTMRAMAQDNLSPREVMVKVNERVYADTKENVFVTMTYGILDTRERTFRFARAGHEPLVTTKAVEGPVRLSSPDGIAMGLVSADMFGMLEEAVLPLESGDIAIMYTDGVVEAMDDAENEYGQQRFFGLIAANHTKTPQEIIENTLTDIGSFTKGHPQHDDITMVVFRVVDRGEVSTNLPAPALQQSAGA
ncbi:MAG: PP2C family protein-serine/threonine phosphatase [Candidatus Sumerlaeaceae bacterium]